MKNYVVFYITFCFLFSISITQQLEAQPTPAPKDVWQTSWEGVPSYYQKWNYPDFQFPSNVFEWKKERIEIRNILVKLLGEIPPRPKSLQVKTIFKEERNGYIFEKFEFDNGIDGIVPGYIAIPMGLKGKAPAILGLHGHSSSKDNIMGTDPSSQSIMALLVSNNFIVMAIDSYFNGERRGTGPAGIRETQERGSDQEMSQFKINLWFGRSLWGMQLRDEQIALDYLESRPEVDKSRIGVSGMSMGSTRSWWLAGIDERVSAVVGVACFTRYKELIEQKYLSAHGIYYFVPGMLNHFDTEALMGLIAPHPFLVLTGDSDSGSPLSGIKVLEKKLETVYSLYDEKEKFKSIIYPNTGHIYTDDMKMEMLKWFQKYLKP